MKKLDFNEEFSNSALTSSRKIKSKRISKRENPTFLNDYGEFLKHRNYSASTIKACLERTKQFSYQFEELFNKVFPTLECFMVLTLTDIEIYEDFLTNRVVKKEIKDETAYSCIKNMRLFLQFLNYKEIIYFDYKIPKNFMVTPTRVNMVIPKDIVLKMCEFALNIPKPFFRYRTLAILLLLVDTGCRPLEISNIKLNEVNFTEKKIVLNSVKSGQRTLSINPTLVLILKTYIKYRDTLQPQTDNLFVKRNSHPFSTANVSATISSLNYKTFGKSIANSRAFRHTYITNAIENNNEFEEVSEAVGHKHWYSTQHYLHRSKNRLLDNTLPFDPTIKFTEEIE